MHNPRRESRRRGSASPDGSQPPVATRDAAPHHVEPGGKAMDKHNHIMDAIERFLAVARTRRDAVRWGIAGGIATVLAAAADPADAANRKKRRRRRRNRRRCPGGKARCFGACVDKQSDPKNCGFCGRDCDDDEICQDGDCVEPACTVCDDDDECAFQSVQAAIDAAEPGSVISICAGTYQEAIVIDKDLELRGAGSDDVTLQGTDAGPASVVVVKRSVTASVSGVSITGGKGTIDPGLQVLAGGGIYLEGLAFLTVSDSIVADNEAELGAGIFCSNVSRLTLNNTSVVAHTAVSGSPNRQTLGGGIYARPGVDLQILENSIVAVNEADIGAGIYNQGVVAMTDSILSGNEARLDGGGMVNDGGVVELVRALVGRNRASTRGGGIHVDGGRLDASSGTIIEENSGGAGGGVNVSSGGKLFATDVVIRRNEAQEDGGGVYSEGGLITLVRTDVIDNDADERGGGIFNGNGPLGTGTLSLQDSDVRENKAGDTGGGIFSVANASVTIDANSTVRANDPDNCVGTNACNA